MLNRAAFTVCCCMLLSACQPGKRLPHRRARFHHRGKHIEHNQKGDRVYRIATNMEQSDSESKLATGSPQYGCVLRQSFPQAEEVCA